MPDAPAFTDIDELVSGSEGTKNDKGQLAGKYFLVSVPNFTGPDTRSVDANGVLLDGSARTSFLRLGVPPGPWGQEPGADLARLVYVVGPAGNGTPNPDAQGQIPKIRDPDVIARFSDPANPGFDQSFYDFICPPVMKGDKEVVDAKGKRVVDEDAAPPVFPPFIDDLRHRGKTNENPVGPNGHGLESKDRKAISSKLETNCGWRDHADGNRITTTAGDKIEVIQGNYKLIVLGRTNDLGQGMGWEASGNNVQDFAGATMPGASVTVTWIKEAYNHAEDIAAIQKEVDALKAKKTKLEGEIAELDKKIPYASTAHTGRGNGPSQREQLQKQKEQKQKELDEANGSLTKKEAYKTAAEALNASYKGGAWLLQNSTERVYQYSRNAGNFKEEQWGDLLESYTGSENPRRVGVLEDDGLQGHPDNHYRYENSAQALEEQVPKVSSVGLPRGNPHIIEKTWATKMESYTGSSAWKIPEMYDETWAESIKEEVHCSGTISSKTWAERISEETHCAVNVDSRTYAGSVSEVVVAGAIASTTTAAVIVEETKAAAHVEMHTGALHSSIELGGVIDLFLGGKIDIDISKTLEVTLIEHKEFKTKKEKALIAERTVALETAIAALDNKQVSVRDMRTALSAGIKALQVQIGI